MLVFFTRFLVPCHIAVLLNIDERVYIKTSIALRTVLTAVMHLLTQAPTQVIFLYSLLDSLNYPCQLNSVISIMMQQETPVVAAIAPFAFASIGMIALHIKIHLIIGDN